MSTCFCQVTRKQCYELYRQKWQNLADHKKLKYIKKAQEAFEKYEVGCLNYAAQMESAQSSSVDLA